MVGSNAGDAYLKSKPKTKRGEETLSRLCEVAEELFTTKNFYGTSVNEIVLKAGISIGTFYIYFDSKLNLYRYLVMQYSRQLRKYIAVRLAEKDLPSRYETEREGIKLFLDFCVEHPAIFSIVWQSLYITPDLFIKYYDEVGKHYEKQLAEAIRTGEVYPVNLEVASYVLMAASNFLTLKYVTFGPPSGLPEEQVYRIIDDLMFILKNGLFTDNNE